MTPAEAADHLEIQQVLYRYCRGVDRGDVELLKSVYHEDATDDHGTFKGLGRDFAVNVIGRMNQVAVQGQHQVTNTLIQLDGDKAAVESYFIAFNPETDATGQPALALVIGRYLDRFEKRNGAWKIADRKVVIDHAEAATARPPWPRLGHFALGRRGPDDPSTSLMGFGR